MQDPPADRTASADAERPEFTRLESPEEAVSGDSAFDRVYSTALQLREPATVSAVAERSRCSSDTARKYLTRFRDMGLVYQASESPATFAVDRRYLRWRRANRLSRTHSQRELVEQIGAVTDEIAAYNRRYQIDHPNQIDITDAANRQEASVEDVWADVSDWKTALERRDVLETALEFRRQQPDESTQGARSEDRIEQ